MNGFWLDGKFSHTANKTWYCYGKLSDFIYPGPSSTWVFADEHPDSINDAGIAVTMATLQWIDYPSTLHDNGGSFSFADGHAELHKWVTLTLPKTTYRSLGSELVPVTKDLRDLKWVEDYTTARVK